MISRSIEEATRTPCRPETGRGEGSKEATLLPASRYAWVPRDALKIARKVLAKTLGRPKIAQWTRFKTNSFAASRLFLGPPMSSRCLPPDAHDLSRLVSSAYNIIDQVCYLLHALCRTHYLFSLLPRVSVTSSVHIAKKAMETGTCSSQCSMQSLPRIRHVFSSCHLFIHPNAFLSV